jgi:hypothetical protein
MVPSAAVSIARTIGGGEAGATAKAGDRRVTRLPDKTSNRLYERLFKKII